MTRSFTLKADTSQEKFLLETATRLPCLHPALPRRERRSGCLDRQDAGSPSRRWSNCRAKDSWSYIATRDGWNVRMPPEAAGSMRAFVWLLRLRKSETRPCSCPCPACPACPGASRMCSGAKHARPMPGIGACRQRSVYPLAAALHSSASTPVACSICTLHARVVLHVAVYIIVLLLPPHCLAPTGSGWSHRHSIHLHLTPSHPSQWPPILPSCSCWQTTSSYPSSSGKEPYPSTYHQIRKMLKSHGRWSSCDPASSLWNRKSPTPKMSAYTQYMI
jgi:hypothetical protein